MNQKKQEEKELDLVTKNLTDKNFNEGNIQIVIGKCGGKEKLETEFFLSKILIF